VVQAFLPPEESARASPLTRAGFRHVARVWQMRRNSESLATIGARSPVASRNEAVALVPYPACDPSEFEQVLVRCHDDSLDCPELHGVRTPAELLAGYRDCAPDPAQWWLALRDGNGIGVLLLSSPELVFVGVVPERRGQGIGRMLVEAARDFTPDLNVTVDSRNLPAVQLYTSVGFITIGIRDVFIGAPQTSAGAVVTIRSRH
jgi:mycothiol synthase